MLGPRDNEDLPTYIERMQRYMVFINQGQYAAFALTLATGNYFPAAICLVAAAYTQLVITKSLKD